MSPCPRQRKIKNCRGQPSQKITFSSNSYSVMPYTKCGYVVQFAEPTYCRRDLLFSCHCNGGHTKLIKWQERTRNKLVDLWIWINVYMWWALLMWLCDPTCKTHLYGRYLIFFMHFHGGTAKLIKWQECYSVWQTKSGWIGLQLNCLLKIIIIKFLQLITY